MTLFKGERIREATIELRGKDTLAKKANKDQVGMEKKRGRLGWMKSGFGHAKEGLLSHRIAHQTALDPVVGIARVIVAGYQ